MKLISYLNFPGNAKDAMEFYHSVFGGEIKDVQTYGQMPGFDQMAEFQDKKDFVLHGSLETPGFEIYFSDSYRGVKFGDSTQLSVMAESAQQVDEIFSKLAQDAKEVTMPVGDTFWGARYASFTDKFGIVWQINYQYEEQN